MANLYFKQLPENKNSKKWPIRTTQD